tara:strand:- start:1135 stop:3444 length:2310 start_codon:yes stop_codon:yes gene_type:complete
MSLIITSSEQAEQYGRVKERRTRTQLGVEKSADYKNHFTVPLPVPADAEIAVESVKIRRGALYDIADDALLYRYFGRLQEGARTLPYGPGGAERHVAQIDEILSMPIPIRPKRGTYTLTSWANELNTCLMRGYQSPELWGHDQVVNVVSNASGSPTSLSIGFTQRGSASGSDVSGSLTVADWINPFRFSMPKTNNRIKGLNYVPGTKRLVRDEPTTADPPAGSWSPEGYNDQLDDRKGCTQLKGFPLGLVHGKCVVKWENCSNNMRCGFARPQQEWLRGSERQICNMLPGTQQPRDDEFGEYGNANYPEFGVDSSTSTLAFPMMRYQVDYYDYSVEFNHIGDLEIYHTEYNPVAKNFTKVHLQYWDPTFPYAHVQQSHTSLAMDGFDSFKFETFGDELRLWAHDTTGMTGDEYLVSSTNSSLPGRCWNPINECRNALYFKATLGKQNQFITVDTIESHYNRGTYAGELAVAAAPENISNASNYRYPLQFTTDGDWTAWATQGDSFFVSGDDFYSNNRVPKTGSTVSKTSTKTMVPVQYDILDRPYANDQTFICDTKRPYTLWVIDPTEPYVFDNLTSLPNAIDYEHALVIGPSAGDGRWIAGSAPDRPNSDYMEGKYATQSNGLGDANISTQLGFGELSYLVQTDHEGNVPDYVDEASNLQVIFTGPDELELKSNSCFVRLPRLTIQSFNGAKSSVSKIVYQVPKFTNDGRQYGELYFHPGEKTYIRLENTEPFLLNNLDVQLVDVAEKVVDDLTGTTIIVFHVRKARD